MIWFQSTNYSINAQLLSYSVRTITTCKSHHQNLQCVYATTLAHVPVHSDALRFVQCVFIKGLNIFSLHLHSNKATMLATVSHCILAANDVGLDTLYALWCATSVTMGK